MVALAGIGGLLLVRSSQGDSPPDLPTGPEYAESARFAAPQGQQAALSDGEVTFEEYETAIAETIACAEAAGVDLEVEPAVGQRPTRIGFKGETVDEMDAQNAKVEQCKDDHLREVETTWSLQNAHASDDEVQAAFGAVTECMLANGASGPELEDGFFSLDDYNHVATANQRGEEFPAVFHEYRRCKATATEATGYPMP
jgi:hypothetical protein